MQKRFVGRCDLLQKCLRMQFFEKFTKLIKHKNLLGYSASKLTYRFNAIKTSAPTYIGKAKCHLQTECQAWQFDQNKT